MNVVSSIFIYNNTGSGNSNRAHIGLSNFVDSVFKPAQATSERIHITPAIGADFRNSRFDCRILNSSVNRDIEPVGVLGDTRGMQLADISLAIFGGDAQFFEGISSLTTWGLFRLANTSDDDNQNFAWHRNCGTYTTGAVGSMLVRNVTNSANDYILNRAGVCDTFQWTPTIYDEDGVTPLFNARAYRTTSVDFGESGNPRSVYERDSALTYGYITDSSGKLTGTADASYGTADMSVSVTTFNSCLLYTSPSPRDRTRSRMPSSA